MLGHHNDRVLINSNMTTAHIASSSRVIKQQAVGSHNTVQTQYRLTDEQLHGAIYTLQVHGMCIVVVLMVLTLYQSLPSGAVWRALQCRQ